MENLCDAIERSAKFVNGCVIYCLSVSVNEERVKGFRRGIFMSQGFLFTSQYIDWCRTRVDVVEKDDNEVEKEQPNNEKRLICLMILHLKRTSLFMRII